MTALQALPRSVSAERRFYAGMAIAMVASIVAGFLPFYYLRGIIPSPVPLAPLTPLVHLHGAVFTAWMLLFLSQVLLVANRRSDLHRRLGISAMVLLPAMLVIGTRAALYQVARASGPPVTSPLNWLSIPLLSVPVYTGLIGAALLLRRNAQTHKRLMLIAMIEMSHAEETEFVYLGLALSPDGYGSWALLLGVTAVAFFILRRTLPRLREAWSQANTLPRLHRREEGHS